jgi:carboxymethylenebutenolidase
VAGPLPGVIVIHEWWGLNQNIRSMTERLAGEGYAALAVDLYEGQVADDPDRARQLASASRNRVPAIQDNLRQARDYLAREVEAPKIGSIGWCFGGGWSLATAELLGDRIDAAVIYYGRLTSDPQRLLRVEAPILGIFGSEDRAISVESVREFEAALQKLDQPVEIHIYEGADHAFANPSGTRYDAEAAADAWQKTRKFLREHLRP